MIRKSPKEIAAFNSLALDEIRQSQRERFPYSIEFDNVAVAVHAKVFSPKYFFGWRLCWKYMPPLKGKVILDMGTGTGISAILFARAGARRVLAVDLARRAVLNARKNVLKNRCANVEVCQSDLFQNVSAHESFNYVYFHFPFLQVPSNYRCKSDLERAIFDPGSRLLIRFLSDAINHLSPEGKVVLGWGDFADWPALIRFCAANDLTWSVLAEETQNLMLYQLVELSRSSFSPLSPKV